VVTMKNVFSIIIITRGWHNRPIVGRRAEWTQLDSTPTLPIKKMKNVAPCSLVDIYGCFRVIRFFCLLSSKNKAYKQPVRNKLQEYDAVWSGRGLPTFQRNAVPPSYRSEE
jgi:hypothetical protein